MKVTLSKSAIQLREQIDDAFPDRDRKSDGWIGDARHAASKSDHNPDPKTGIVRALDIDSNLDQRPNTASYLAEQLRQYGKSSRGRITYIIFNKRICSPILNYKWRTYKGIDPHTSHIHVSFDVKGDNNREFYQIPLLGGKLEN